jgi:hypothetical protein
MRHVPLSRALRGVMVGTAFINLIVGVLFLVDPDIGSAPWPTDIAPVLARFIGAIILGNAAGAAVVAQTGSWEGARALFAVALVYGLVALVAVTIQLAVKGGPSSLWIYVAVDALFIGPIAAVVVAYERHSRQVGN